MKKRTLSAILLSTAVLPSAFLLTSCGGSQIDQFATVNTSGNYVASEFAALETYIASNDVNPDITSGFHFSVKMDIDGETAFVNMLIKTDDLGVPTAAALKMEAPDTLTEIYIKDNIAYSNISATVDGAIHNEKKQTTLSDDVNIMTLLSSVTSSFSASTINLFSAINYIDAVSELVEHVDKMSLDIKDYLNFEVAQNGTSTKFHVNLKQKLVEDSLLSYDKADIFICFENNNFVGAKCEQEISIKESFGATHKMSLSTAISIFNGEIQVPNFDTKVNGGGSPGHNKNPFASNLF